MAYDLVVVALISYGLEISNYLVMPLETLKVALTSKMAYDLVVVALISYGLEISHCAYASKPNHGLKDNMLAPFIGFGRIHTVPLFNLLPHTLMECLHHLCLRLRTYKKKNENL